MHAWWIMHLSLDDAWSMPMDDDILSFISISIELSFIVNIDDNLIAYNTEFHNNGMFIHFHLGSSRATSNSKTIL